MNESDILEIFSYLSEDTNEVFWLVDKDNRVIFYQDTVFKTAADSGKLKSRFEEAVRKSIEKFSSLSIPANSKKSKISISITSENRISHYRTIIKHPDKNGIFSGITANITSEIVSGQTLARNETVYRTLLKTIPDAIVLVDSDGDIIKVNEKMAEFADQVRADMIGTKFTEYISDQERAKIIELIASLKPGDSINDYEFSFIRNDGSRFHAELTATFLTNSVLNLTLYIIAVRDITVRKEAQIRSESIQRELLELFFNRLSDRELELLGFIKNGSKWPSEKRQIAKTMYVLPGTLDKFMTRIKAKLQTGDLEKIIKIYSQFTE
ncbi:MAG: PAS domain S-box protein [Spirochaetes bacterium]|nr:PAS domain S-box protein [Spirochaetota bacterium]